MTASDRRSAASGLSLDDLRMRARRRQAGGREALPPLVPVRTDGPQPLTFAQERLWFTEQLGAAGAAYNLMLALRLRGALDPVALEGAFVDLQRRHAILRSRFDAAEGVPSQRIVDRCGIRLRLESVEDRVGTEREAALRSLMLVEQQRRFDLTAHDPLRAVVIREGEGSHVLLVVMHHIAGDNWSFNIILDELAVFYSARLAGGPPALTTLEVQYGDFAAWQRRCAGAAIQDEQLDYWTRTLAGFEPLRLPTDHQRPAVPSHRGGRCHFRLSNDLSAALAALVRARGATMFMGTLAIFLVVLARSSGQRDIVVGTAIAGRPDVRTESLVGLFLNMLAIRADLSGDVDFSELLSRVRQVATQAYGNQDVPFDRVVKAVQPGRDLASHPVFQVTFTLAGAPQGDTRIADLHLRRISDERVSAQFDLSLSMQWDERQLAGVFEFATDLFRGETIERMRDQFVELAGHVVRDPAAPVMALPMMTAEQRARLLHDWATAEGAERDERFVQDVIGDQAARTPLGIAVDDGDTRLTYAELDRRSDVLACRLIDAGVVPDELVAVYLRRGVDLVVAILGVLKAGAGYLPLDPAYYSDRTHAILADAAPRAIVAPEGGLDPDRPVVPIDDLGRRPGDRRDRPDSAALNLTPAHLAYAIYTSGSTGCPKGVCVDHAGVSNLLHWYRDHYAFAPSAQVLVATSCGFDLTQKNYFAPLMTGGCLHLAREPFDARQICASVRDARISLINLTPSAFYAVADVALDSGADLSSLRDVILGGEILNVDRLRPLARRFPQIALTNSYGPTECTDIVTAIRLDPGWGDSAQMPVSIGRPIRNTRCYILDDRLQPVPPGIAGEICIGGVGVGRGYLHRADLTRERFVDDPHADRPGGRLYRTGDIGRWRSDGLVDYLDRSDRQVKIRGFRVEPADIEAALMRSTGVRNAAVVCRERADGEPQLVAYVVPAETDGGLDVAALRKALAVGLPTYMVPAAIVPLREMPVTASGKLDRRALPAPVPDALPGSGGDAPSTDTETILAGVWAELLKLPRIGVTDNPFDLGADSLLLLRVAARAATLLDRPIAVADFFRFPTVRDLAGFLDRRGADPERVVAHARAEALRRLDRRLVPARSRGMTTR